MLKRSGATDPSASVPGAAVPVDKRGDFPAERIERQPHVAHVGEELAVRDLLERRDFEARGEALRMDFEAFEARGRDVHRDVSAVDEKHERELADAHRAAFFFGFIPTARRSTRST